MIGLSNLGSDARQPKALERDPILEAICEFRFVPKNENVGSLLPGLMYSALKDDFPEMERLASADLPAPIRQMDPNLRYTHLFRLKGDGKVVSLSDRSISVSVLRPYPGWNTFGELVARVWEAAFATGLIGEVERCSVKYVNFIPELPRSLSEVLRMNVQMGEAELQNEKMQLRVEFNAAPFIIAIAIANNAHVSALGVQHGTGFILDIDIIQLSVDSGFPSNFRAVLDAAHEAEKRCFYALLSEKTLSDFGPIYE